MAQRELVNSAEKSTKNFQYGPGFIVRRQAYSFAKAILRQLLLRWNDHRYAVSAPGSLRDQGPEQDQKPSVYSRRLSSELTVSSALAL